MHGTQLVRMNDSKCVKVSDGEAGAGLPSALATSLCAHKRLVKITNTKLNVRYKTALSLSIRSLCRFDGDGDPSRGRRWAPLEEACLDYLITEGANGRTRRGGSSRTSISRF